jgi:Serine dehydrogenase proteinase
MAKKPKEKTTTPTPVTRIDLIKKLEQINGSSVICLLTSLRNGVQAMIADDQVRVVFDHLLAIGKRPIPQLDLFLVSNGGSGVVPWRLVSLFREFAEKFRVLIPYRAYSAATLIALGADEIVMHPFGELGPIDPSVSNDFNPRNSQGQAIPISVEDVKAYVAFIKRTVGITHEDELVKTIEALCAQVHPLALGNVERFVSQSRMIATKVLKTHMDGDADHIIDELVENMTSKLYFHGHPINRREAKQDLKLKVLANPSRELEDTMWALYCDFEKSFKNAEPFFPSGELFSAFAGNVALTSTQSVDAELLHAAIESASLRSESRSTHKVTMTFTPNGPQLMDQILSQGWHHSEQ